MNEHEELLEFFYRTPVGLALISEDGTVSMLNATGAQLLMPYAGSLNLTNLFDVFDVFDTEIRAEIAASRPKKGPVVVRPRIFSQGHSSRNCLSLSVERLATDRLQVVFQDATQGLAQETELVEMAERLGIREGQGALTATIVHDLGNALVATRTELTQLGADSDIAEIDQLTRLVTLLTSLTPNLVDAIGDTKTAALRRFIDEVVASLNMRQDRLRLSVQQMLTSFDHAEQIISLNRTLALGSMASESGLDGRQILADGILLVNPMARNVQIPIEVQRGEPVQIHGDRTRLIQLIVNVLKNALEACDAAPAEHHQVVVQSKREADMWVLSFDDTGPGLTSEHMAMLNDGEFPQRGGLGLRSCRAIVDSHNGELTFSSSVRGGLRVQIKIPHESAPDA